MTFAFLIYANVALASLLILWLVASTVLAWFQPGEETAVYGFRYDPETDPDEGTDDPDEGMNRVSKRK